MKRVNRAKITITGEKIKVVFFKHDWDYNDELIYVKVGELIAHNGMTEFAIGNYEITIYTQDFEKEILFYDQRINDEEYKEYLREEKEKLLNADELRILTIDYCSDRLEYFFNKEWKDIKAEKCQRAELLFKNAKIYVEKF